jgi:hypothetical protein
MAVHPAVCEAHYNSGDGMPARQRADVKRARLSGKTMWRRRSGRSGGGVTGRPQHARTWTARITVDGYVALPAARSERDEHDDQIMAAAHDAARLMRRTGAEHGEIHLLRRSPSAGDELVEWRIVTFDQRGLVVSENQRTDPYHDPIAPADKPDGTPRPR